MNDEKKPVDQTLEQGNREEGDAITAKPKMKPGRVDGKNSEYKSGDYYIPKKIRNEIEVLLSANRDKSAKSSVKVVKKVGASTQEKRGTNIRGFFSDLFRLKYRIETVYSLKPKHLLAVFNFLESKGQSPSVIQNKISTMRIFAGWIGKAGMVKESSTYVKDKASARRTTVVQEDKSWVGNGVNVVEKLAEIAAFDLAVGIWLELCWAFGMRVQEAVMFRPVVAHEAGGIWLREGTKGDRGRFVPIENERQLDVLQRAKQIADGKTGYTGKRGKTVEQKLKRLEYVLRKFGVTLRLSQVTAHGLRHQYMHENYKLMTGIEPPVRGGDITQVDEQKLHGAKQKLMERAGHTRTSIGVAYYGSDRQHKEIEPAQESPSDITNVNGSYTDKPNKG